LIGAVSPEDPVIIGITRRVYLINQITAIERIGPFQINPNLGGIPGKQLVVIVYAGRNGCMLFFAGSYRQQQARYQYYKFFHGFFYKVIYR
jgi:hypothetical protein